MIFTSSLQATRSVSSTSYEGGYAEIQQNRLQIDVQFFQYLSGIFENRKRRSDISKYVILTILRLILCKDDAIP